MSPASPRTRTLAAWATEADWSNERSAAGWARSAALHHRAAELAVDSATGDAFP